MTYAIEWMVHVRKRAPEQTTDFFIFRKNHTNGIVTMWTPKGDGIVEEKDYKSDDTIPPSFTIPSDLVPLLLQAMIREGVESPKQSFVEGKLEATESHLNDLRHLLKLPKTI